MTRDKHHISVTSLTQQIAFSISLQMHLTHKLIGDQTEYNAVLSAIQTDAAKHCEQVLTTLYPLEGSAPIPGPTFPTTCTFLILPTAATAAAVDEDVIGHENVTISCVIIHKNKAY